MGAASRLRSPTALMGALAAETESSGMEFVEVKHVFGTSNTSGDALSRLSERSALLQLLDHVPHLPAPHRESAFKVWCCVCGLDSHERKLRLRDFFFVEN